VLPHRQSGLHLVHQQRARGERLGPVGGGDGDDEGRVADREVTDPVADRDDVREPGEYEINRIPGAVLQPRSTLAGRDGWGELARRPLVVYCKSGRRSAEVVQAAIRAGREDVVHLAGGVDAWISACDPAQPRY
jgi:adenylyltransferase/sulfurtransferase